MAAGCRSSREAEFFLADEEAEGSVSEETASETEQEEKAKGSASGENRTQTSPVPEETESGSAAQSEEVSGQAEPQKIYVDVCGAVARPGVYALDPGSRVFQAIETAGGFLPEAAGTYINQAQTLSDGQQIYVPTKEEAQEMSHTGQNNTAGSGSPSDSPQGSEDAKVNLNTADADALMTLSGIGEAKAEAILAYREEHGGFSSIEEIMNVSGIKESTFSKIKDKISVE